MNKALQDFNAKNHVPISITAVWAQAHVMQKPDWLAMEKPDWLIKRTLLFYPFRINEDIYK